MMFPPSAQICIVLVRPRHPGNVGAVARAMGNFGVTDLRLVDPCAHLHPEAHKFAANASHLLGGASVHPELSAALAGCDLTVATTRRGGRQRGTLLDSTELPRLAEGLPVSGRIALVFGPEDTGLSSAEVALCGHAVAVATSDGGLGSLNLGQAVLLFLYELARGRCDTHSGTGERR